MSKQNIKRKEKMNQNVLKYCKNFGPEFLGPSELCHFEPQDNNW